MNIQTNCSGNGGNERKVKKTNPYGNLPTPLSSFIGRERELSEAKQLLFAHRLVTLTGSAGSGKTRLAIKPANELVGNFEDSVWLNKLALLSDPKVVPQLIGSTLGIRERSNQTLMDLLAAFLFARQPLLIIDNWEHLISACAEISETLL